MESSVLSGGAEVDEVVLGSLRLEERAELVKLAVRLLQEGWSESEIIDSLETYIRHKRWAARDMYARCAIVAAAQDVLWNAEADEVDEPGELQVVSLLELEPQAVRWLWPGRIPLGKVTMICGPVQGKTCLALDLAARVSAGAGWPDEATGTELGNSGSRFGLVSTPCCASSATDSANRASSAERPGPGPGRVVLLNGEDHWGDTIRPRLVGGGANLENITAISGMIAGSKAGSTKERSVDLERDLPALRQRIEMLGDVRLVIIDSLTAFCGPAIGQGVHRLQKVVASLAKLADECGVAVVVISSGNKCVLPVKQVWHVDCDVLDPELRLWVPVKFANGPCPSGLAYRISETGIVWESQPLSLTANRLRGATAKQERNSRLMAIAEWLKNYLAERPRPAKEVLEAGGASGWSADQVKRAKLALGVACHKESAVNGRWIWQLSTAGSQPGAQAARPGPPDAPAVEAVNQADPALEWLDRAGRLHANSQPHADSVQQSKGTKGSKEREVSWMTDGMGTDSRDAA